MWVCNTASQFHSYRNVILTTALELENLNMVVICYVNVFPISDHRQLWAPSGRAPGHFGSDALSEFADNHDETR